MQIVELGDYSMVIMKDSSDPPWFSVGDIYREATDRGYAIEVSSVINFYNLEPIREPGYQISSEAIYASGRLILYFSGHVDSRFHLHDNVILALRYTY